MPEISIIVPVYKVEKYLRRCIDSILAQTFTDFELILVDDGSPDRSGEICDNYSKNDSRIAVIHKPNRGASSARNTGLRIAKGNYIAFCDSDDVVSSMWLERLYHFCVCDDSILPIGAYCLDSADLGTQIKTLVNSGKTYSSSAYYLFQRAGCAGYLCNALYRKDIIEQNNLHFREDPSRGDYNEDLLFTLAYVKFVKRLIYTGYADYCYCRRDNSLSQSYEKCFFDKYSEKYYLWKENIERSNLPDATFYISNLSTTMLYHFLVTLHQEVEQFLLRADPDCYNRFKRIVCSPSVQECLQFADCSNENPTVIRYLKSQNYKALWLFFILHILKGRILK